MMNKVVLTGHTSPMGKELCDHLSKNYEVVGVSRDTGYDLINTKDIDRVVDMCLEADLFINLAHIGTAQSLFLKLIDSKWTNKNRLKQVISIGSLVTKLDEELLQKVISSENFSGLQYLKEKQELDATNNSLANEKPFGEQPQYTLLRVLNYGAKTGSREHEPTCTAEEICRTIDYIINEPMYVSTLNVRRY